MGPRAETGPKAALAETVTVDGALGAIEAAVLKDPVLKVKALKDRVQKANELRDRVLRDNVQRGLVQKVNVMKDHVHRDLVPKDHVPRAPALRDHVHKAQIPRALEVKGITQTALIMTTEVPTSSSTALIKVVAILVDNAADVLMVGYSPRIRS